MCDVALLSRSIDHDNEALDLIADSKFEKFSEFLDFFAKIHCSEFAYGHEFTDSCHAQAAQKLFEESIPFLNSIPLQRTDSVIDVGLGYGQHCGLFSRKGFQTTGISVHLPEGLKQRAKDSGFSALEMDMHFLDFPDNSFDLVWSHHSLEHSFSPLFALREWLRVLRPGGYLAVTVPPHKTEIVSGHFNVGWNVGQLIYLLGICGFEVAPGYFVEEGYNVRALVKKPVQDVVLEGLSWMVELKDRLPPKINSRMKSIPNSLGKFSFEGSIKEASPKVYVEKKQSRKNAVLQETMIIRNTNFLRFLRIKLLNLTGWKSK